MLDCSLTGGVGNKKPALVYRKAGFVRERCIGIP